MTLQDAINSGNFESFVSIRESMTVPTGGSPTKPAAQINASAQQYVVKHTSHKTGDVTFYLETGNGDVAIRFWKKIK